MSTRVFNLEQMSENRGYKDEETENLQKMELLEFHVLMKSSEIGKIKKNHFTGQLN